MLAVHREAFFAFFSFASKPGCAHADSDDEETEAAAVVPVSWNPEEVRLRLAPVKRSKRVICFWVPKLIDSNQRLVHLHLLLGGLKMNCL
jgi:hypothetical protein